jgi:signal transduction histidine kinase
MATRPELSPTLKAVSDAVLAVAAEQSVEDVLQRLVHSARELATARYAALGLPDGEGGFRRFLTSGMSDELIELLAAHAAIAIANARLYETTRELSIHAERNRLALELHDAVSQKLFGLVLNAEAASTLLESDPEAARGQVGKLRTLAQEALDELRSLMFELRPPDLERDGLAGTLRKHVEVLRHLQDAEIELDVGDTPPPDPGRDREVLRIAQEALQNALRHAEAKRIFVRLQGGADRLTLEIEDDGTGFDPGAPGLRSRRLGLTSMEERAERLGGWLEIRSVPGAGTTVRLEVGAG